MLGDTLPTREAEPCTCKSVCLGMTRGFFFAFAALFLLHLFLFVPILLPATLLGMTVRACCCRRMRAGARSQDDYAMVANDAYPASAASKDLELKEVYVGVPTVA